MANNGLKTYDKNTFDGLLSGNNRDIFSSLFGGTGANNLQNSADTINAMASTGNYTPEQLTTAASNLDFSGKDTGLSGTFDGIGGMKGLGTIAGIGTDIFGIVNQNKALRQASKAWEAENARANDIMAMKKEQYDTFKADKAKLNAGY